MQFRNRIAGAGRSCGEGRSRCLKIVRRNRSRSERSSGFHRQPEVHLKAVGLADFRAKGCVHLKGRTDSTASKIDPVQDLLAVLRKHGVGIAIEFKRQPCVVLNATGDPHTREQLVAQASANRIALILRIGKMAGELSGCGRCIVPEKKAASHREPRIADRIRVADKTRELSPVRQFELAISSINSGAAECDRKADGRVGNLVVIRIVVNQPAIVIRVQTKFAEDRFGQTRFVIISFGGFDRQAEKICGVEESIAVELESRMFSNDGVWNTRS